LLQNLDNRASISQSQRRQRPCWNLPNALGSSFLVLLSSDSESLYNKIIYLNLTFQKAEIIRILDGMATCLKLYSWGSKMHQLSLWHHHKVVSSVN